jgi:fermentation-respiration switch protein FrsA (DUF1100 family)
MKSIIPFLIFLIPALTLEAQQSYAVSFIHDSMTVYGTFTTPNGTGKFPTIVIDPGSGPSDRDLTLTIGQPYTCLYPGLTGNTIKSYKELSDMLVDSGYAVLRYDKLEYTYGANLGTITFHKLWLPVESALNYLKTRNDVDTSQLILIGHSEGSYFIPYISNQRKDIKTLISIAGARTPFDSLLAHQYIYFPHICNGDTASGRTTANQILSYYNLVRNNQWTSSTPPAFGVSAGVWYNYLRVVDSVAINYNQSQLPTLFIGFQNDLNVPPYEFTRFESDINRSVDFYSLPDLIHYMNPYNTPHVSPALADTIVYWLRQHSSLTTGIQTVKALNAMVSVQPNPFNAYVQVSIKQNNFKHAEVALQNLLGQTIISTQSEQPYLILDTSKFSEGVYFLRITSNGQVAVKKIIKY